MAANLALYHKLASVYYQLMEWLMPSDFCLVDTENNKVVFQGSLSEVECALDQQYGRPHMILREHELPENCDTSEELWGLTNEL